MPCKSHITVVMPVYNGADHLSAAIVSGAQLLTLLNALSILYSNTSGEVQSQFKDLFALCLNAALQEHLHHTDYLALAKIKLFKQIIPASNRRKIFHSWLKNSLWQILRGK